MVVKNREQCLNQPQRVVSLLGSATEIIFRLGLGERLVGRSHECDYPPAVLDLPCVSRPRLDVNGSSSTIDKAVRLRSANGEPIYKLDDEELGNISPIDLLITQDHCRVCAVTPTDVDRSEALAACANVKQLVLRPSTLSDCMKNVNDIANAMGFPDRGETLRITLEERLDRVREVTATPSSSSAGKPRVAVLEWCDPIMGCGYWIPEIIEKAGGVALHCPPPGGATPTVSFRTLLDSEPDVVIFALCGFGLTRAFAEVQSSWKNDWITNLRTRTRDCVYFVDGNYLVNRSGPRIVESCEAIAEAIHPHLRGHFGHFGTDLLATFDRAATLAEIGEHTGSRKVRPEPFEETNNDEARSSSEKGEPGPLNTTARCVESAAEVVSFQLKYLEEGKVVKSFALNSYANQDRWCGAERFASVLRSHSDFRRLFEEHASVGKCEERGDISTVVVTLPANEGEGKKEVRLLWTMVAQRSVDKSNDDRNFVWRTEKVGLSH